MTVDLKEEISRIHSLGLLDKLLADKTTEGNILWATDACRDLGPGYGREDEMQAAQITGERAGVIQNRAGKALEQQSERTRQHAEVFTPLWVCAKMNDFADEEWFGRPDVFTKDGEPTQRVTFPAGKGWKQYICSRRLEITCGEAPYLASRYDVTTGERVPIERRVGILDRKLRVVSENTTTEEEWLTWALRAFQSTYGYEFQGDNVLIARINLYMTFEEALFARWGRRPTQEESAAVASVIAWNLWQMDGLINRVPFSEPEETDQLSIFSLLDPGPPMITPRRRTRCLVFDWAAGEEVAFSDLSARGSCEMKFDFIIGNPPYQAEVEDSDNKTFMPPVYNLFLDGVYEVSDKVELIHPARFLFNAGQTPKTWNEKMLADPHLKVIHYEPDGSKVFPNTEIKGGLVITYHDKTRNFGAIEVFTKYDELNSLLHKVTHRGLNGGLSSIMFNQNRFDLDALYQEYPRYKSAIGSNGRDKRFRNNIFEKVDLFTIEKTDSDDVHILGVVKNKRQWRYFPKRFTDLSHENLFSWKIVIGAASGAGTFGESLSQPIILEPAEGYTQTYIGVGSFDTRQEAENLAKYIKTKFLRAMLGVLKITQHNDISTWRYVPLQDFTPASDIDWSKPIPQIDRQLYAKYGLDEAEIAFIESHVKEMK